MNAEKVIEVAEKYHQYAAAERYTNNRDRPTFLEALRHAAWMCEQIIEFAQTGRMDKAFRWLGFVQGTLWTCGVATIDEMKRDNMPAPLAPKDTKEDGHHE